MTPRQTPWLLSGSRPPGSSAASPGPLSGGGPIGAGRPGVACLGPWPAARTRPRWRPQHAPARRSPAAVGARTWSPSNTTPAHHAHHAAARRSAWRYAALTRRGQVLAQHLIDPPGHRLAHRRRSHRGLTIGRQRRGDRLPHRAAVHVILAGQRPDRHPVALLVEADSREQLHSLRPHPGPTKGTNPLRHHERSAWPGQLSRTSPACRPPPASRRGQIKVLRRHCGSS
jgi:hypothetical protein